MREQNHLSLSWKKHFMSHGIPRGSKLQHEPMVLTRHPRLDFRACCTPARSTSLQRISTHMTGKPEIDDSKFTSCLPFRRSCRPPPCFQHLRYHDRRTCFQGCLNNGKYSHCGRLSSRKRAAPHGARGPLGVKSRGYLPQTTTSPTLLSSSFQNVALKILLLSTWFW